MARLRRSTPGRRRPAVGARSTSIPKRAPIVAQPAQADNCRRALAAGDSRRVGRSVLPNRRCASAIRAGCRSGRRLAQPRGLLRHADPFQPRLQQGRSRLKPADVEPGDQRLTVDRSAEQAADIALLQRLVADGRRQPEQSGDRIESPRAARHLGAQGIGQVADRSAKHQVEIAIGKGSDQLRRLAAGNPNLLDRVFRVGNADPVRQEQAVAPSSSVPGMAACSSTVGTRNGPVPTLALTSPNSGCANSCSRLGRGAFSRISITRSVIATICVDRAQRVLQRVGAGGAQLPAEDSRDILGLDLAPVGPFASLQPEDVAEAVVADVPTLREARERPGPARRTVPGPGPCWTGSAPRLGERRW